MAWFSAIVPATFTAGMASALFLLPFWAAGGVVAKSAVVDPFKSAELTIGEFAWSVRGTVYGKVVTTEQDGPTDQLRGATAEVVAYMNGVPQCEMKLYDEAGLCASLGLGVPMEELDYLVGEINDHLGRLSAGK